MELIKSARRRTRYSEVAFFLFTLLVPIVLLVLVRAFEGGAWVALIFVLLSKWRIFAVRPRFWLINVKTNLIDVIVGFSYVLLLATINESLPTQIALTALFMAWVFLLRPKSKRHHMGLQSIVGLVSGLTALFMYVQYLDVFSTVCLAWLVGYAAARHAISGYEEEYIEIISVAWALLVAEMAWVFYHWTLAYPIYAGLSIPQIAVVSAVVGFAAYHFYDNHQREDAAPSRTKITFTLCAILLVIILVFSRWSVTL